MNKQYLSKVASEAKKAVIESTITSKLGSIEELTLKQSHANDFDLKMGSRSIVRIIANKKEESNGIALFTSARDYLDDIRKLASVKESTVSYNIEEIGKTESCFYRFNFETIGSALNASVDVYKLISEAIKSKKAQDKSKEASKEDKSKEADKKTKEASKEADKDKSKKDKSKNKAAAASVKKDKSKAGKKKA